MAERARIGYLSGSAVVGGTERYLRELACSIDRRRFEPVILSRPSLTRFFAEGRGAAIAHADLESWEPSIQVLRAPWSALAATARTTGAARVLSELRSVMVPPGKQLATALNRPRLKQFLAGQDLDLIHVHNGGHPGSPTALAAVLAAADLEIPTVLTVHGIAKRRGRLRRIEEGFDRRLAAATQALTTVGRAPARALAELRGFDAGAMRVIPTGIRVPPTVAARGAARAALGLGDEVPVVGSIAAFIPVKGHVAMLDSLAQVRDRAPDAHMVLAGEGPGRSHIADCADAMGLGKVVHFPGPVDPFATVAAFDVFVSASTTEGLPLSILEAMSQAVPIVATAVGSVPEAVVDGESGYLVEPGDIDGLARRLTEVLTDPTLARGLGEAGRRHFNAYHRVESMVATFEGLYHEVVGQPQ